MSLIDLVAIEYNTLFRRNKPSDQFTDEMLALCSVLDKRQIFQPRYAEGYEPARTGGTDVGELEE